MNKMTRPARKATRKARKPDPIKALLKRHPGPWKAFRSLGDWTVLDDKGWTICRCYEHRGLARAIAALGRKK